MKKYYRYPVVLTVAGSDSGGGAGIQADLKTFSALGCYGTSAITAITVQNTTGVSAIHSVPVAIVCGQMEAVLNDIRPAAIKIGMIHSSELAAGIGGVLRDHPDIPVILDPVMVATSGDRLIHAETVALMQELLFPLATLVTPNMDEAAVLAGLSVTDEQGMRSAGKILLARTCRAVLMKGGHLPGHMITDMLFTPQGSEEWQSSKIETQNTHGTGCSLSSAIAAGMARGMSLREAILTGRDYVHKGLLAGKDVKTGEGHGPLNHFFDPLKLIKNELD